MKKLVIKKGWFYGAGTTYGWKEDGFDIYGVGIAKEILLGSPTIEIEVSDVVYRLDTNKAVEFIKKYRSFYNAGVEPHVKRIGVVSKSLLEPISAE